MMAKAQTTASKKASAPEDNWKGAIREDFMKRLEAYRVRKGWNQSDLARQAAVHMADKSFGRDLVSSYERGKMLPGQLHLKALAAALGVTPEDLLPTVKMATLPRIGDPNTPLSTEELGDGRVMLRVNQATDWPTAIKIMQILKGEDGG